jgi:hypothetical protein
MYKLMKSIFRRYGSETEIVQVITMYKVDEIHFQAIWIRNRKVS